MLQRTWAPIVAAFFIVVLVGLGEGADIRAHFYGFISGIIKEIQTTTPRQRVDISRNVDLILTNRVIGFPIFILIIWAMFQLTFTLGEYPTEWIDNFINLISIGIDRILPESLLKKLFLDGIIAGVGSVIVFLPNIRDTCPGLHF